MLARLALQNSGPLVRPRGLQPTDDHPGVLAVHDLLAHAQFLEILLADDVPSTSALAALPEPDVTAMLGVHSPWGSLAAQYHFSTTLMAALAHERLGCAQGALVCASIILEADLAKGGTRSTLWHSFAHASRGRVLAGDGRADEAEASFAAAVETAEKSGSHFFAALAVRDLCRHVLDNDSRGEEGRVRLEGIVSSRLACTIEDLGGIAYP